VHGVNIYIICHKQLLFAARPCEENEIEVKYKESLFIYQPLLVLDE
jgi:hypothetical protein